MKVVAVASGQRGGVGPRSGLDARQSLTLLSEGI
jgi:hypothetical protein